MIFLTKKEDIIDWLDTHKIKNYELIADDTLDEFGDLEYNFVVNVGSGVDLAYKRLTHIPVKFNVIKGNFFCYCNKLTTLKGCPEVVHGNFNCSDNNLTNLHSSPNEINGSFVCNNNELTTLYGCTKKINGNFDCSNNHLSTLEGCPEYVSGNFYCNINMQLGYIQKINDFNQIQQIANAKKEHKLLNKELKLANDSPIKKGIIKV